MYCGNFWSEHVKDVMTYKEALSVDSEAIFILKEEGNDPKKFEYAISKIPNLGPGGENSEEDLPNLPEDASEPTGITQDPNAEPVLMAYSADIDELYVYHGPYNQGGHGWLLWNY